MSLFIFPKACYISSDLLKNNSLTKDYAYVYLLLGSDGYTVFEDVKQADRVIPNGFTNADVVKDLNEYIKRAKRVSSLSKLLALQDKLNNTTKNAREIDTMKMNNSVVIEFNIIHPQLCGLYFENVVSHVINAKDGELKFNADNYTKDKNFIEEFMKEHLLNPLGLKTLMLYCGVMYIKSLDIVAVNVNHFRSKWHYFLFNTIRQRLVEGPLPPEDKQGLIRMAYKINDYAFLQRLETFYDEMTYEENLMSLRTEDIHHDVHLEDTNSILTGTADFIGKNIVVDMKVCQDNKIDNWWHQTDQYSKLSGGKSKRVVINLYLNKYIKM